jgi:hypothetical protein
MAVRFFLFTFGTRSMPMTRFNTAGCNVENASYGANFLAPEFVIIISRLTLIM